MNVKNTAGRPINLDRGRNLAPGEFAEVNSRDPVVARHLDAGRLRRTSEPRPTIEAGPSTEPTEEISS